jgi:hypothetical protein
MSESSSPSDDVFEPDAGGGQSSAEAGTSVLPGRRVLRAVSLMTLWLAIVAFPFSLAIHILQVATGFSPEWSRGGLVSGLPLILIGVSYSSLLFTVRRPAAQIFMGLLVGAAFILWGVAALLPDRTVASFINDLVVFLFILDLSIVILRHLKSE